MKRTTRWHVALALLTGSPALLLAQGKVAAPTGVTVSSNATALTVSWNNMANVVQYAVNQRQGTAVKTLATVSKSPYTGPLPTPGTAYEYQAVSIGKGAKNTAGSAWIAYTVPRTTPTTTGVILTEPRPTTGTITPTIVPAGPTFLTGGSNIPGQIYLQWKEVANATGYRITRSSNVPEAEQTLTNLAATSQLAEGGLWYYTDAPVDITPTYSYKVYALFASSTGTTVSTPSPVAMAASAPFWQPTGLKYTAVPSTTKLGTLNVTISWNAVQNAEKYSLTGMAAAGQASIVTAATSYLFRDLPTRTTYAGVCVSTIYPYDVGMTQNKPCIDIKL